MKIMISDGGQAFTTTCGLKNIPFLGSNKTYLTESNIYIEHVTKRSRSETLFVDLSKSLIRWK
jgi:hypothetical protein